MGRNSQRVDASASVAGSSATQTVIPQTVAESSFGPNGVWYFAYGSNMNPNTLKGRRKVNPMESRPGVLRGWKLSFRMVGLPYLEPGFATVERTDGAGASPAAAAGSGRWDSEVHGVLHRISETDWIQVMATEGVGAGKSGYRVVEVEVTQYDGRRVRALTLEGQSGSLHSPARPVAPSARYLNLLRDGARHHGVDPEYITYLDSLQPYDGSGWSAAVGRAVSLAVAVPLALPLLPPIVALRMVCNKAGEAEKQGSQQQQQEEANDGGSGGGYDGAAASSTAAAQPAAATATAATGVTASTRGSSAVDGGAGEVPAQLRRPPLVLPAVASGYFSAIQYVTWALHDVLAATPVGSGSSNGGGSSSGKAQ